MAITRGPDQKTQHEEFFQKYGFTSTMSRAHPIFGDLMEFSGLEANYVASLEHKLKDSEKYIHGLIDKIDWLQNRDFYLVKKGLEQSAKEAKFKED